jgi:hypothetical protein
VAGSACRFRVVEVDWVPTKVAEEVHPNVFAPQQEEIC